MKKILKISVYAITLILMCLMCSVDVGKTPFMKVMLLGTLTVLFGWATVNLLNSEEKNSN